MFLLFSLLTFFPAHAELFRAESVAINTEGGHYVSDWVEFTVPEGLHSLQILVFGSPNSIVQVTDLIDPDGHIYLASSHSRPPKLNPYSQPILQNVIGPNRSEGVVPGTGTLIVPNNPRLPPPKAGVWKMRSLSRTKPLELKADFLVIGKSQARRIETLKVRAWIAPESFWTSDSRRISDTWAAAAKILRTAGIRLELIGQATLPHKLNRPMILPEDMGQVASTYNDLKAMNLYFLEEVEFQNKPVNGMACLGGPVKISRPHHCFTALFAGKNAASYSSQEIGQILAHEIGHYLGLFHTKDVGYMALKEVYDTLEDTSEEITGSNLMDSGVHGPAPALSPQQKRLMRLSPALQ